MGRQLDSESGLKKSSEYFDPQFAILDTFQYAKYNSEMNHPVCCWRPSALFHSFCVRLVFALFFFPAARESVSHSAPLSPGFVQCIHAFILIALS